jgi:mannitol/fructose-specific phosphotransferase system IIA component (Ntr-type)
MNIKDVINENLVKLDVEAKDRDSVIAELTELLYCEGAIESKDVFIESVRSREQLASTYSGYGIAVPHGISTTIKKSSICFGRVKPFDWDGTGETPVEFIFLIAVPDVNVNSGNDQHIDILSNIAIAALQEDLRNQWSRVETPMDFIRTLESIV